MAENSRIEWTDNTFNPWRGCTKVSPGCANCYADKQAKRNPSTLGIWGPDGRRVVAAEDYWKKPLKWNEQAKMEGRRIKVFCASFADLFEDWQGSMYDHKGHRLFWREPTAIDRSQPLPPKWVSGDECSGSEDTPVEMGDVRGRLFDLIDSTPYLDWQLVTKRPENIHKLWLPHPDGGVNETEALWRHNVWLLTSVENQEQADKRIPELLKCRDLVPVLGLSCEPLLGELDLGDYFGSCWVGAWPTDGGDEPYNHGIDWVICGGESGPHARPMHPDWARSLKDQCQAAGVPFFFKQGSQNNWDYFKDFSTFPSHLQAREFPNVHA